MAQQQGDPENLDRDRPMSEDEDVRAIGDEEFEDTEEQDEEEDVDDEDEVVGSEGGGPGR